MKNLFIALSLCLLVVSCNSDDNEVPQHASSIVNDLQGTWISEYYINYDGENVPHLYSGPNAEHFPYKKIITFIQDSLFYHTDAPLDNPWAYLITGDYEIIIENDEVLLNSNQCYFNPVTGLKDFDFTPGAATIFELTESRLVIDYFFETPLKSIFVKE